MLKCSTSLGSADLANLAADIRRVEPYSERFHLDVADGHYVPTLLFFPDLVKALRPHTRLPFEVHLMTTDPLAWIGPFAEAGADGFIVCRDTVDDPSPVIRAIRAAGKFAGVFHLTQSFDETTRGNRFGWREGVSPSALGRPCHVVGFEADTTGTSGAPCDLAEGGHDRVALGLRATH